MGTEELMIRMFRRYRPDLLEEYWRACEAHEEYHRKLSFNNDPVMRQWQTMLRENEKNVRKGAYSEWDAMERAEVIIEEMNAYKSDLQMVSQESEQVEEFLDGTLHAICMSVAVAHVKSGVDRDKMAVLLSQMMGLFSEHLEAEDECLKRVEMIRERYAA